MGLKPEKPLGIKNYGSIGHLPNSRLGPGDHHVHAGQAVIATEKVRDKWDLVFVTEKLDGTNVGVLRRGSEVIALQRKGYPADSSPHTMHRMFHDWAQENRKRFLDSLADGERFIGEWLALAHGTRYQLRHEPFVVFDVMVGPTRINWSGIKERAARGGFTTPHVLSNGFTLTVGDALTSLGETGFHGGESVEGAVWRVERRGEFDFMAKYVRPDKVDGLYLPNDGVGDEVWNWKQEIRAVAE